jgi:RAB6A-GEF complex partner protein 2
MSYHSNIRVSAQFKESTVFAGEDVECIITFRNAAHTGQGRASQAGLRTTAGTSGSHGQRKPPPAPIKRPSIARHSSTNSVGQLKKPGREGTALSKSSPNTPTKLQPSPTIESRNAPQAKKGHGRSLSVLSFSSEVPESGTKRPGHSRASSTQHGSRKQALAPTEGK